MNTGYFQGPGNSICSWTVLLNYRPGPYSISLIAGPGEDRYVETVQITVIAQVIDTAQSSTKSSTVAPSPTVGPSVTTSGAQSPTNSAKEKGLSTVAKVGIGLGVGLGAALLALLTIAIMWLKLRKGRKQTVQRVEPAEQGGFEVAAVRGGAGAGLARRHELRLGSLAYSYRRPCMLRSAITAGASASFIEI